MAERRRPPPIPASPERDARGGAPGSPAARLTPRKRRETAIRARLPLALVATVLLACCAYLALVVARAKRASGHTWAEIVDLFSGHAARVRRTASEWRATRARVHDAVPYWEQVLAGLVFMVAGFLATLIFEVMVASDEPEPRNPLFQDGASL